MLPENEYTTFEERDYIDPNVSLNEQLGFIDNLRNVQKQNNAQIAQQTHNLGTNVPSNLGGLIGGEGYFTSRYQTPQTNTLVADLRATAQAQALQDALKNEQAKYKQRYNRAYRNARRRARLSGGGGDDPENPLGNPLNINTNTGANDTTNVNTNPNTGPNDLIQTGNLTYSLGGKTLVPAPTSFMSISNQGMSLGVWPDGSRMTEGSTYTRGGNTYIYAKADNTMTPNVYQVR